MPGNLALNWKQEGIENKHRSTNHRTIAFFHLNPKSYTPMQSSLLKFPKDDELDLLKEITSELTYKSRQKS